MSPPSFTPSAAAANLVRGCKTEVIDAAKSPLSALKLIARGRRDHSRPLDGEVARQLAREALTQQGEVW